MEKSTRNRNQKAVCCQCIDYLVEKPMKIIYMIGIQDAGGMWNSDGKFYTDSKIAYALVEELAKANKGKYTSKVWPIHLEEEFTFENGRWYWHNQSLNPTRCGPFDTHKEAISNRNKKYQET